MLCPPASDGSSRVAGRLRGRNIKPMFALDLNTAGALLTLGITLVFGIRLYRYFDREDAKIRAEEYQSCCLIHGCNHAELSVTPSIPRAIVSSSVSTETSVHTTEP